MNRRIPEAESISSSLARLVTLLLCTVLASCESKEGPAAPTPANRLPTVSVSFSPPGQAIMAATNLTFTATGSDPDADLVLYSWSFGDGTTATGPIASKVFSTAGTFTVSVTARDSRGGSATASQAVTVRNLTGFWRGGERGLREALDIDHLSGNRFSGKVTTGLRECGGQLSGTVTDTRSVAVSAGFTGACDLGPEEYIATVEPSLQSMTGTYRIGNTTRTWTFTRQ